MTACLYSLDKGSFEFSLVPRAFIQHHHKQSLLILLLLLAGGDVACAFAHTAIANWVVIIPMHRSAPHRSNLCLGKPSVALKILAGASRVEGNCDLTELDLC